MEQKTESTSAHQVSKKVEEATEKFGAKYCATQIADWILVNCKQDREIVNLKLQKLLFYCQAWHMAFYRELLFSDPIEAWEHGPIIRAVYHKFRDYKRLEPIEIPDSAPELCEKSMKVINKVFDLYGDDNLDWITAFFAMEAMWLKPEAGIIDHRLWHTEAEPYHWQTYYSILMPEIDRGLLDDINPDDYNDVSSISGRVREINVDEKYFMFFSAIPNPGETIKCTFDIDILDDLKAELENEKYTHISGCFLYENGRRFPDKVHARSIESLSSNGLFIHNPIIHNEGGNSSQVIPRKGEPGYKTVEERILEGRSISLGEFIE